MPIYEFYCPTCHMIFNFFSKSPNIDKRPLCPRCERTKLDRKMSVFAMPRDRGENEDMPFPDIDEGKMESAMNLLAREAEHLDGDDPIQAAGLMRKLTDMTGLHLGPGMEEALTRMEAGEDPEAIEKEMGDVFDEEAPFGSKKELTGVRKYRPPEVDEKLYDL